MPCCSAPRAGAEVAAPRRADEGRTERPLRRWCLAKPPEPRPIDQLAFDRALEREIAERLANGEDVVTRIVTMRWFTFELEGEDLVVGDEMQRAIEQLAGAPLIEYTPPRYPMDRALG